MDDTLTAHTMGKETITGGLRKDAARNRAALIEAASHCMRAEGGDVPMEAIAERAGVTRGTIYRNFPDRQAMYQAVLDSDLEQLIEKIDRQSEAEPLAFIRLMAEMMMVYEKFLHLLARMPDFRACEAQPRMVAAISGPLHRAQMLGLIRPDLDGQSILIACRMLAGHVGLDNPSIAADPFQQRFELLLLGIAGKGRWGNG